MHRYILYITDYGVTLRDNWRGVVIGLECKAQIRAADMVVIDLRTKREDQE